jgi:hypothetical protein
MMVLVTVSVCRGAVTVLRIVSRVGQSVLVVVSGAGINWVEVDGGEDIATKVSKDVESHEVGGCSEG